MRKRHPQCFETLMFSDELKSNISQRTQEFISKILGSAFIDEDIAFPLLTALVKTDAKAAANR